MAKLVGHRIFDVCQNCGKIVRVNKPVFGGMHIYTLPEERKMHRRSIRRRGQRNQAILKAQ